jgi:hypothetical protein
MKTFVLRQHEAFKRSSLAMLAFGLGYNSLRLLGTTGGIVAADIIAGVGAMMAAYLFELTRTTHTA